MALFSCPCGAKAVEYDPRQVAPKGWEEYAAPFSDDRPRSVADIDSSAALARVRQWKQAQKAKGLTKAQ